MRDQVAGESKLGQETQRASKRTRLVLRWSIARKLTVASLLMIMLALLAGGVALWQVFIIGQTIGQVREKEQQRAQSLELLAAGQQLVASLDHMLLTQDSALMSADVPVSLGALAFHMEALQEAGGGPETLLEEMQGTYDELLRGVNEVNLLARQERWEEADSAVDQDVRPVNERMGTLIRRLVSQSEQDANAVVARARDRVTRASLVLLVIVVLTTGIALGWRQLVFRDIGLSIGELRQGVARISGGDLEHRIDIRTGDEIEELGAEFNKMAAQLAGLIGSLEQRVADRTRGLLAATEVSRAVTSVLDPDELLNRVVNLARERFSLYYVGLFLADEKQRFAVLRAGTGEAGQQMLAQGHKLEVGGESMIGQCVARNEARIALDVGEEAVRFDNPFLPDTRSELALPLRSRGHVIGAMTVQSVEGAAFDETDIAVLQTMADQAAVAIDNARLFAQSQAALDEMRTIQRRYLGQVWTEYMRGMEKAGYEIGETGASVSGDVLLSEIRQAAERRAATALAGDHAALVAPVALRDVVIGAVGVHDDDGARRWTEEEIELVEAIAERMALAADNLRLLEETQRSAARERLIGEVTTRVRETLDMETVLKTAVQEVRQALNLPQVVIRLATPGAGSGDDGK